MRNLLTSPAPSGNFGSFIMRTWISTCRLGSSARHFPTQVWDRTCMQSCNPQSPRFASFPSNHFQAQNKNPLLPSCTLWMAWSQYPDTQTSQYQETGFTEWVSGKKRGTSFCFNQLWTHGTPCPDSNQYFIRQLYLQSLCNRPDRSLGKSTGHKPQTGTPIWQGRWSKMRDIFYLPTFLKTYIILNIFPDISNIRCWFIIFLSIDFTKIFLS